MAILKRHPNVPPQLLQRLSSVPELFQACPIEVKRQIWQIDHKIFKEMVSPLLEEYVVDPDVVRNAQEIVDDARPLPKKRREHRVVQELVNLIGRSTKLYSLVLHFLRGLFAKSGSPRFHSPPCIPGYIGY